MRMALICAAIGLLVGVGFAVLLALMIQWNQPDDSDEELLSLYSSLRGNGPAKGLWSEFRTRPVEPSHQHALNGNLFLAILVGGGFGAMVGVVVGATSAISRAIRDTRPFPEMSEQQEEVAS